MKARGEVAANGRGSDQINLQANTAGKNMNWRKNQGYNNASRKRKNDKKKHAHVPIQQWKDGGGFHQKESPRKGEKCTNDTEELYGTVYLIIT